MKLQRSYFTLALVASVSIFAATWRRAEPAAQAPVGASEEAYRANNIGVALLEQFKFKEGVEQFRRALALDPKLTLAPIGANLRWRGFSRAVTPDGREPYGYDYEQVCLASPWKVMPGRYTREGDVRALLLKSDDMFVIARPGDELSLSFDAAALPPLPHGWTRTFLLYADGFSKEMDINSASPEQVSPLPFHGMTKYPYLAPESYPLTAARRAYIERYNTRLITAELPSIDSVLRSKSGRGYSESAATRTPSAGKNMKDILHVAIGGG